MASVLRMLSSMVDFGRARQVEGLKNLTETGRKSRQSGEELPSQARARMREANAFVLVITKAIQ